MYFFRNMINTEISGTELEKLYAIFYVEVMLTSRFCIVCDITDPKTIHEYFNKCIEFDKERLMTIQQIDYTFLISYYNSLVPKYVDAIRNGNCKGEDISRGVNIDRWGIFSNTAGFDFIKQLTVSSAAEKKAFLHLQELLKSAVLDK